MISFFKESYLIIKRDIRVSFATPFSALSPLLFFLCVAAIFPFVLGHDLGLIKEIGPSILWSSVIFSALISLRTIFEEDYLDGSLEQLLLSLTPIYVIISAKIMSYWVRSIMPVILILPVIVLIYGISPSLLPHLIFSFCLGTIAIAILGGMISLLTLGLASNNLIQPLLVLPLIVPVIIFSIMSLQNYQNNNDFYEFLSLSSINLGVTFISLVMVLILGNCFLKNLDS